MRYLLLMALVFGAYFAAMTFIGDKYVPKDLPPDVPPPDKAQMDLMEGKIRWEDVKRSPDDPNTPPVVSVQEY